MTASENPLAGTAPTAAYAVRGEGISVTYRGRTVLDQDAVSIEAGTTYALLGPSGAGKSTLLRVLGLLERPSAGRVEYDGHRMSRDDLTARRSIAVMFQKPYLLRGTVGDNAGYGLRLRRVPASERRRRVSEALARVGLEGWEDRSALTLSGGEAQRVALARAIVLRPRFLVLDEPLSYLDPLLKRDLSREFARILESEHVTTLYVTHDQDEAAVVADVIGVMRDGRIVAEGSPDDILGLPRDAWLAAFVGMEPPLRGRVVARRDGSAEIDLAGARLFTTSDVPVGAEVLFAVRPEDITLHEAGTTLAADDPRNALGGVISHVVPQGGSVQVIVRSGEDRFAAALSRSVAARRNPAKGDEVVMVFDPEAVRARPSGD
jgi:ABC-type Fe3+/spermidine/putrescine transport system ATPase subunit